MEFISTKGMTNNTAPDGQVLVQYLEPFFGSYKVSFAIGYFDNPNDYTDGSGEGWKHWETSRRINVIAYAELPETMESEFTTISQKEFKDRFGSFHPNLGCVGS